MKPFNLSELPKGWVFQENAIKRQFEFADFKEAWEFMNQIAVEAERMNHHPDWSNVYNRVTITLSTHNAGGVTRLDLDLANFINSLLE